MRGHEYERDYRQAVAGARGVDVAALEAEGIFPHPMTAYLTGTYPPLKAMAEVSEDEVFSGVSAAMNVYLHVPFCAQRCTFCHFAKEIQPPTERIAGYIEGLTNEMDLVAAKLGWRPVLSVYVGGGTPSLLAPRDIERVLSAVHAHFDLQADAEVTFELHPQIARDVQLLAEKLRVLIANGVNRVAFGAQTLDERILRTLNRGHTADEVFELLRALERAGIDNVSVDLMYGLPYETPEAWHRTLTSVVGFGVAKLNVFPLFL